MQYEGVLAHTVMSLSLEDRALLTGIDNLTRKIAHDLEQTEKTAQKSLGAAFNVNQILQAYQGVKQVAMEVYHFIAPIIEAGAAAEETANLVSVTFGESAADIKEWAETASSSLVQTRLETQRQAGVLLNMVQNAGLARDQAIEMAKAYTELTGDLASFFNLSPEDAFTRIQSAISGQIEPLRRLGISIDEETLKQSAMRAGIIKSGEELDRQTKTLAIYHAILDQTTNAQGDLIRTQDSFTNLERQTKARTKELVEELGSGIIQSEGFRDAMKTVLDVLEEAEKGGSIKDLGEAIGGLASTLASLVSVLTLLKPLLPVIAGAAENLAAYEKSQVGFFKEGVEGFMKEQGGFIDKLKGFVKGSWVGMTSPYAELALERYAPWLKDMMEGQQQVKAAAKETNTELTEQQKLFQDAVKEYAKAGDVERKLLVERFGPDLVKAYKESLTELDKIKIKSKEIEEVQKAQAKAAKEAAQAYESVMRAYEAGVPGFKTFLEGTFKHIKEDAQKVEGSLGEQMFEAWKKQVGLIGDDFKKIPVWALEAWDNADAAQMKYLSSTYGVTDAIKQEYEKLFLAIPEQQRQAMDEMVSGAAAARSLLASSFDMPMAQAETKQRTLDLLMQQLTVELSITKESSKQEQIKRQINKVALEQLKADFAVLEVQIAQAKANEQIAVQMQSEIESVLFLTDDVAKRLELQLALQEARMKEVEAESNIKVLLEEEKLVELNIEAEKERQLNVAKAITEETAKAADEAGRKLDNERAVTRELRDQSAISTFAWTSYEEVQAYGKQAYGMVQQGKAEALLKQMKEYANKLEYSMYGGPEVPEWQMPSGFQRAGIKGPRGSFENALAGGTAGFLSDIQAMIQALERALQAYGKGEGIPGGTEGNPLVVRLQGGGMGITQAMETMA